MKKYFITSTGTDTGKTFYAVQWIKKLRAEGKKILALKPVISGFDSDNSAASDTGLLLAAQGLVISNANIDFISPWRFAEAISPDMAAEQNNISIKLTEIVQFCEAHAHYDYVIIEGAGGVMTPVGMDYTNLDIIDATKSKAILICGSYLGSISHSLTALYMLTMRGIMVSKLVLNESRQQPIPLERTLLTLQRFVPKDIPIEISRRQACA